VKPKIQDSVYGKCHIQLSPDDIQTIEKAPVPTDDVEEDEDEPASVPVSTEVEDSDEEEAEPEPEPVKSVKKVIKKAAPEPVVEASGTEAAVEVAEAPKKKVIKKKVVA
jgi:hypothetical protein